MHLADSEPAGPRHSKVFARLDAKLTALTRVHHLARLIGGDEVLAPVTESGEFDPAAWDSAGFLDLPSDVGHHDLPGLGVHISGFRRFLPEAPEGVRVLVLDRGGTPEVIQVEGPPCQEAIDLVVNAVADNAPLVDIRPPARVNNVVRLPRTQMRVERILNAPPQIKAERFTLRDPASIPMREWLWGRHYIRKYLTVTVGAGGSGKSAHAVSETLAMVTGRPLLDPDGPLNKSLRVWYINAEDPSDEIERRFIAAALHFGVDDKQVGDRLFTNSGRDHDFVIMNQVGRDLAVCEPLIEQMVSEIKANEIDVVIVDPFVSTHEAPENDNGAMQRVAKAWLRVAEEGDCGVELIHHIVKGDAEVTADSARGGGALKDKARSVRTLNPMTREEATKAGVGDRTGYFRVDFGKANMAPRSSASMWRRFANVALGNGKGLIKTGDEIGVVESWRWPSSENIAERLAKERATLIANVPPALLASLKIRLKLSQYKHSEQAKNWAGLQVGEVLEMDMNDKAVRRQVRDMLEAWIASGDLEVTQEMDARRHFSPHIRPVRDLEN